MAETILWALVIGLLVGLPVVANLTAPARKERLANADTAVRRRETLRTIGIQWTMGAVLLLSWLSTGRDLAALRFPGVPRGAGQWFVALLTVAVLLWLIRAWVQAARHPDIGEQVRASVEPSLLGIAPRTPVEHRRFVALSFTAGICEELAYRGVALGLVAEAIGMPIAALATTLAFGLSHAYQGARGIVRTGAVGLVFVGITLGSGSLLLAMTVHALVDVFQGRLLSAAVTPGRDG